uniref:Uncharacterized protein n=1 Tax=Lepeophtheirus salmonis TaxID=72036 RepID=A0A0K2V7I5_LEPSM
MSSGTHLNIRQVAMQPVIHKLNIPALEYQIACNKFYFAQILNDQIACYEILS